jgi:hypothetical protein
LFSSKFASCAIRNNLKSNKKQKKIKKKQQSKQTNPKKITHTASFCRLQTWVSFMYAKNLGSFNISLHSE